MTISHGISLFFFHTPPYGEQTVEDISGGCGTSFTVSVVAACFEGKRLLDRHRLINCSLQGPLQDQIHALSIAKALTPQQWEDTQGKERELV